MIIQTNRYNKLLKRNIISIIASFFILIGLIFFNEFLKNNNIYGNDYRQVKAEVMKIIESPVEQLVGKKHHKTMKFVKIYNIKIKYNVNDTEYQTEISGIKNKNIDKELNVYYNINNPNEIKANLKINENIEVFITISVLVCIAFILRIVDKLVHKELYL